MSTRPSSRQPDRALIGVLKDAGLIESLGETTFEPLTGGVSSEIWKVETSDLTFCVKRALKQLNVTALWLAPVERNRFEVAWFRTANGIVPGSTPRVLFDDDEANWFAMEYLQPGDHAVWKSELLDGRVQPAIAAEVGRRLAAIHAGTAGSAEVAVQFPRTDIFQAIRLEPYLEATAERHQDIAPNLYELSRRTAGTRLAMIHGDVSPKNILIGPNGPVFLDAECATIGDPAFDLAFCLNHFLLKCLSNESAQPAYAASFQAMASAYLGGVEWENADVLERRAASLLPGLFLARIDGKSPVEYVTEEDDKRKVRRCARGLIKAPPSRLEEVIAAWQRELAS
ncbi:MAG: aminoglycoside phosphotransferase family protein [Alphaproteobacteria bacterium]|nr:aminoglycoside phosphotransferase family protein [Alphaproteobacteria bacterium]